MHLPVLFDEIISGLDPAPGDVVMDGTAGGGGHASEILRRITPGGKLIAVDRDPEAIERTRVRLTEVGGEVIYVNDNFRNVGSILAEAGVGTIDGAVFDLGVSSFQIDEGEKGFSFLKDGPLDMRFDPEIGLSAAEVVNRFSREELATIIRDYGEERHSRKVAEAICAARKRSRIRTTAELAEIIRGAIGGWYRDQRLHCAARTFQALRIFVNDELGAAEEGVKRAIEFLNPGGRICVISFHSLEDRIIKNIFRDAAKAGVLKLVTKKPIVPTQHEMIINPRSRSAKLRIAEKVTVI